MPCARRRRLEDEAHQIGRERCLASAEELGLHMSCDSEYECGAPDECDFFKNAMAEVEAFDGALP